MLCLSNDPIKLSIEFYVLFALKLNWIESAAFYVLGCVKTEANMTRLFCVKCIKCFGYRLEGNK